MKKDWIIDVLCDLRTFADLNDLPALASQLDAMRDLAAVEIAASAKGDTGGIRDFHASERSHSGPVGTSAGA